MVEEMMLLANVAVAEVTARYFPSCSLLRRHPAPSPRQFEPIVQAAAAVGLTLDVSSSKVRACVGVNCAWVRLWVAVCVDVWVKRR
jgi:exosome complex exonuclease DIS3/RRP44